MEPWRVADLHHLDEEQDPESGSSLKSRIRIYQREKPDPNLHPGEIIRIRINLMRICHKRNMFSLPTRYSLSLCLALFCCCTLIARSGIRIRM